MESFMNGRVIPLEDKEKTLEAILRGIGSAVVAFSGGVDSSFLAYMARRVLGARAVAVCATSPTYPSFELEEARRVAAEIGVELRVVESNELQIEGFSENPPDRCYFCKRELFGKLRAIAESLGLEAVLDGSNADDRKDHRPGRAAARELGVMSPLLDADLGKEEIRVLSRRAGLSTAEKPAFACLASRFPYFTRITPEKLRMVDRAETFLRELGFKQYRVRHHGDTARIELAAGEIPRAADPSTAARIVAAFKQIGFLYVALDLEGYRTGSMNETLAREKNS
jgi:uncharacterized protein